MLQARTGRWYCLATAFIVLTMFAGPVFSSSPSPETPTDEVHPNMFLNQAEIDAIRARIAAGEEPWASAYQELIGRATALLEIEPPSVIGGAIPYEADQEHIYFSCNPSAAVTNPRCDNRHDYQQARTVNDVSRTLGLAYVLSEDPRFADKLVEVIRAWVLDEDTYMEPVVGDDQQLIEQSLTMTGFLYGIDLLWNYEGWPDEERLAVREWARELGWSATEAFTEVWREQGRDANIENWKNTLIAAAGVVGEDPELREFAWDWFRMLVPMQYDATDESRVEGVDNCRRWGDYTRGNGLFYSLFGLKAQMLAAEIARHHGLDLYSYQDPERGRGIECALEFHAGFAMAPETWPWSLDSPIQPEHIALYHLAYLWQPKPLYEQVLETWDYPPTETRVLGPIILTHSHGAYDWQVYQP